MEILLNDECVAQSGYTMRCVSSTVNREHMKLLLQSYFAGWCTQMSPKKTKKLILVSFSRIVLEFILRVQLCLLVFSVIGL